MAASENQHSTIPATMQRPMRQCQGECTVSDFTVCFPDQQIIPNETTQDNPFYDFTNKRSYWTYKITINTGSKYEHWALQICALLAQFGTKNDFLVEFSDDNGVTFTFADGWQVFAHDNLTGLDNALRISESQNPPSPSSTRIYRITILSAQFFNLMPEQGTVVVRRQPDNFTFDPTTCSVDPNTPILTPSVACNETSTPLIPPIPPPSIKGQCEKILAEKVLADQVFICKDTVIVDLGQSFSNAASLTNAVVTLVGFDGLPIFDTTNNQIMIDLIYHFLVNAIINEPPNNVPLSVDFDLICQENLCGVTADIVPAGAFDQVNSRLLRSTVTVAEPIVFTPSNSDFNGNATLTITLTVISKLLLLQTEQLVIGVCSDKNTNTTIISAVECGTRYAAQDLIEEIRKIIRQEIEVFSEKMYNNNKS